MPLLALALLQVGQAVWKPFAVDGVAVSLPAAPTEQKSPGAPVRARYWTALHNGRNVLVLASSRLGAEAAKATPDQILAGSVAGTLSPGDGTLLAQADALREGWPAVEFRWRTKDGMVGVSQTVVYRDRVFQYGVLGDSKASVEAPFAKLAASVRLPADVGKGPQTSPGPAYARYPLPPAPGSVEFPAPPKDLPAVAPAGQAASPARRLVASYGNRSYLALVVEVPEPARTEIEDEAKLQQALQTFNDHALAEFDGKLSVPVDAKLDGGYAVRTTTSLADGRGFARVESTYRDGRLYGFVAIVPAVLKDAPEVARYFASVRLTEAK